MNKSNIILHKFKKGKFRKDIWIILAVFIGALFLSFYIARQIYIEEVEKDQKEFSIVCNEIKSIVSSRLHAHALTLRSGAAYFRVAKQVSRQDWKEFNENSKIDKNLPGILGYGFSLIVPKDQLQHHIESIRAEGYPNYNIYPEGDREIYTSIIYLEPFSGRNLRAFGYDMFSEPVRRRAMETSRDNDVAMLSGKVDLVQETKEDVQAGTLMYVPYYQSDWPTSTVEERRKAIRGWVYSPYRMNDLMKGILGERDQIIDQRIHLIIYDDSIAKPNLLYNSQPGKIEKINPTSELTEIVPVEFNGKKWILCFSKDQVDFFHHKSKVFIFFISALIISILLSLLTYALLQRIHKTKLIKYQNEQLRSLNNEKDRFFSIIAHDLKSPFNSIVGFSNLLVEQSLNMDKAGVVRYAKIIHDSSLRALELLRNLMDWSRSQTGRMEFAPEFIEIADIINENIGLLNVSAQQKSIKLKTSFPLFATLFADRDMLSTIIRNLISNAIKFSEPGNDIMILVEEKSDGFHFSVQDFGVGISKENMSKLFQIGSGYSTQGTQKEKGTGLGLILCKEFVEKHGGKIGVESEKNKGSVFYFTIPCTNIQPS